MFASLVVFMNPLSTEKCMFVFHFPGQPINPVVENSDEQLPSLSDLHDYEPKLEFDDTEINEPYKSPIQGALPSIFTFHLPTLTNQPSPLHLRNQFCLCYL